MQGCRWLCALLAGGVVFAGRSPIVRGAEADVQRPGFLSSAETNFKFALQDVCLAYVADQESDVLKPGWGISSIGWGPQRIFKSTEVVAHLIGVAGRINVGVKDTPTGRLCIIEANLGDGDAYRRILLQVARERPEGFQPAKSPIPANAFASRDFLCATAKSSALSILMSTAGPRQRPVALVTVSAQSPRSARCDQTEMETPLSPPPQ